MNGFAHHYAPNSLWKSSLVFECIFYWAVPIFLMISGANLLDYRKRYDTKTFFKKRFTKILIPWIFWSFLTYLVLFKNLNIINFISKFLSGDIVQIYWFFPLILFLYCLIPILSPLTENKEGRNILWGIVIVIAMFKSILIPLSNIFGFTIPEIASNFIEINGYLIFVILGYLLSVMDVSRVKRIIIYIIGILSVIIRYGYTYCMSINANMLIDHLFDYTSLLSVFLAVSVFLLIKNISWDKLNEKRVAVLASCTMGVYLIHIQIKYTIFNTIFPFAQTNLIYRILGTFCLYILSVIIVLLIKKMPIINKVVP
mgnify:FL=1